MRRRRLWSLTLVAAAVLAADAACGAAGPTPPARRTSSGASAAIRALTAQGDAGSLAAAAALRFNEGLQDAARSPATGSSGALDLAARATQLAPDDAAIHWLRLQLCVATPGCDSRDAATNMRWVDPDNAAAWLPTLMTAQKDRDAEEVDRVLADMAHSARFDLYWNRVVVMSFDALSKARHVAPSPLLSSDAARLETVLTAAARVIPPFQELLAACRETEGAERHEACRRLSKIMQRSDTVAAQLAGFGIERRLSPPDGREARTVADRKRTLEWRMMQAHQLDRPLLPWLKSIRARGLIALLRRNPREEDVYLALLRAHQVANEPPRDHP